MREKIKSLFTALLFALGTSCVLLAPSAAQAQTYVRPSKGTPVTVFDVASVSTGVSTLTSAVFDTSAFVELQLDAVTTKTGTPLVTDVFNVSRLGRYVKLQALIDNTLPDPSITYLTLGAEAPADTFYEVRGPGARQVVMPNAPGRIESLKLVMTPLPYTTNQYTRPAKGNSIAVINRALASTGITFTASKPIDMRGFAAISVSVDYSSASCKYYVTPAIYGGASTNTNEMRVIATENAVRAAYSDTSYALNVPTNYISVRGTVTTRSSGSDCLVSVVITPLPYTVPTAGNPRAEATSITYQGTGQFFQASETKPYFRIENHGTGAVQCCPSTDGTSPGPYCPLILRAASGVTAGDGGSVVLQNFSGYIYCLSAVSGGTSIKVGVFSY